MIANDGEYVIMMGMRENEGVQVMRVNERDG